jgi:Fe-S-cluster containining protein
MRDLYHRKISGQKNDYISLQQIPCPFLSEEKACLVYPARPLACRALTATSSPEECKHDRAKEHFVP